MFGSPLPPVVCRRDHVLIYGICVCLRYIAVSNTIVLCFLGFCFRLVYTMLLVSLDFSFLITPSVFSKVYIHYQPIYTILIN